MLKTLFRSGANTKRLSVGGGGGGAFSPSSLAGLVLWLNADTIRGLAPDAQIASWPNSATAGLVGSADQSVAVNRPHRSPENAFNPDSPNGGVGVSFNQAIPFFASGSLPPGPGGLDISAGLSCYFWGFESLFGAAAQVIWQDQAGGSPQLLLAGGGGGIGLRDGVGTDTYGAVGLGSFFSGAWTFAPPNGTGTFRMYLNGTQIGTRAWSFGATLDTAYFLGANQVANAGYAGMMYEFLVYNQAHDAATVAQVLSYGSTHWGI